MIGIYSEIYKIQLQFFFLLALDWILNQWGKNAVKDVIESTDKCGIWVAKYYTDIFKKYKLTARGKEMLFSIYQGARGVVCKKKPTKQTYIHDSYPSFVLHIYSVL